MRIALIHALAHSGPPIVAAFSRLWPVPELIHILDDSLSRDRARGVAPASLTARFLALSDYARLCEADAILFTCSAFGDCIDACIERHPDLPIHKPNTAMIEEAIAFGAPIGLLASFLPTLSSMGSEFPPDAPAVPCFLPGVMDALDAGDELTHDSRAVQACVEFMAGAGEECRVLALAQFSLARAAGAIGEATGLPVLTTPDSAVRKLKELLETRR